MSDLSTFQSVVERLEAMHPQTNEPLAPETTAAATISQPPSVYPEVPPMKLQPIEDFEREQDAIDAQLAVEARSKVPKSMIEPMKKKPKKVTAADELDAEERAVTEMGGGNWVGRLQIYRDSRPVPGGGTGIKWTEGVEVNPLPRFNCTLVIHETMNRFGHETIGSTGKVVSFSNKKSAKQYAAKKAVDWLIANEYMPKDGAVQHKAIPAPQPKKPKIPPPQPKVKVAPTTASPAPNECKTSPSPSTLQAAPGKISYAQRIPDLCHRLGVNIPSYKFIQDTPGSPICDAYADFGDDPLVDGRVGEVWNVYGKKNAREEVAKILFSFLKNIEQQRMAQFNLTGINDSDESDDEDRKRKRESEAEGGNPELKSKSLKVDD